MSPPRAPLSSAELDRQARLAVDRAEALIEFEVVEGNGLGESTLRVLQSVKGPYAAGALVRVVPLDGAACGPGPLATGRRGIGILAPPREGRPAIVWRIAAPEVRAALVRIGLLDRR